LLKFVASRQSFFQVPNLTFHENPPTGSPLKHEAGRWMDGWMPIRVMKPKVTFRFLWERA